MVDTTLIITVALAALIVVVLALIGIIIYQRWRIGDQNVSSSASSARTRSCDRRCSARESYNH